MRHGLRKFGNRLAAGIPTPILRMFMKVFLTRPDLADRAGFHVCPAVFWSPVPDPREINLPRLLERRFLPGVDLRESEALHTLERLVEFAPEIQRIPRQRTNDCQIWLENDGYNDFDAASLYALIRWLKPKRYIEVGCGLSTRVSTLALAKNTGDGSKTESLFIEPFPGPNFVGLPLPGKHREQKVQDVPLDVFSRLEAGDILFIDTSHVLKTQSDVEHELLRLLPSLKAGVWVHIHDIFTPFDYPQEWITGHPRGGNNEQYALECLLSGGSRWQIEFPVYYLWREHRQKLDALCPGGFLRPGAFWIRKA
jgi:hypothetical protein